MAIRVPCPRCKHTMTLPDSAGGCIGRCKFCNGIVRIPLAPSQQKHCFICRADISSAKRVKDHQGHYYCATCWAAQKEAQNAGGDDFWSAIEGLDKP